MDAIWKCAEKRGNGCHRQHGHRGKCKDQYGEVLPAVCQVNNPPPRTELISLPIDGDCDGADR